MDALTFWLAVALTIVSLVLAIMTRRAQCAEWVVEKQAREIRWLKANTYVKDSKGEPFPTRHAIIPVGLWDRDEA